MEVVKTLENTMSDHDLHGKTGTVKQIVKGYCFNCGCNRLIHGHKEPAGIAYMACPACDKDNMSTEQDWNYTTKQEQVIAEQL